MIDPEFVSWVAWRALVAVALVGVIALGVRLQRWDFDECLRVAHTAQFCTFNYPFGSHR